MSGHGTRAGRIATWALVGIGFCALGAVVTESAAQAPGDAERQTATSNERIKALTAERYDILRHIADSVEKHFASGMATLVEWRDAKLALYRAQADLCTDRAKRIAVHEEMVDFLRKCEQLAQRSADAGRATQIEVDRARVATIEAQIALERLRLGQDQ